MIPEVVVEAVVGGPPLLEVVLVAPSGVCWPDTYRVRYGEEYC